MNEGRPHLLGMLAGLFLAAGLVLCAMLGTSAWLKIKHSQFITVKGSARKNIVSDFVIWRGSFITEATAEGMNDTTSLEKTIIAVVTATFSLK